MKQYLDIKNQHPGSIVLFRMGDFFETFNEDAKITANILGIALTKRANGAASEVPLAGFPHHALDNYLPKLVKAGHRVAICEDSLLALAILGCSWIFLGYTFIYLTCNKVLSILVSSPLFF